MAPTFDTFADFFAYERSTRSILRAVETGEEFETADPPEGVECVCVRVPLDHELSPAMPTRQIGRCIYTGEEFETDSVPEAASYTLVVVPLDHVLSPRLRPIPRVESPEVMAMIDALIDE